MGRIAVVSGYATVDYVASLPQPLWGATTASVVAAAGGNWPQAGGAAMYASRRIAAAGHHASALCVVGEDDNAVVYLDACRAADVNIDAICRSEQVRTPWCTLLHHDDGSCTCLIDRGNVDRQPLTAAQISLVRRAELVCIAAGPADIGTQLLDIVPSSALLAWIAKNDSACFPNALARRLAQRADVIFCNASERTMIDAGRRSGVRTGQSIVETRGARGLLLEHEGRTVDLDCEPLSVRDTTGAGDTLAGEVLAALLSGVTDMEVAVRRGIDAARSLLISRIPR